MLLCSGYNCHRIYQIYSEMCKFIKLGAYLMCFCASFDLELKVLTLFKCEHAQAPK
jgi:hypothetical protein